MVSVSSILSAAYNNFNDLQLDTVVNDVLSKNMSNASNDISSKSDYLSSNNEYKIDLDIPPFLRRNRNDNI